MFPIRDHNPSRHTPYVTYTLIAVNIVVFLFTHVMTSDELSRTLIYVDYGLIPQIAFQNIHTFVTSTFLHAGWLHIGGNLLFLWIYGDNLEDEMGPLPYLGFYLAAGILAGVIQVLAEPYSPIPTVGASGAIAGVMGGYLLLFPKARIDILFFFVVFFKIVPVPAWVVLFLWICFQIVSSLSPDVAASGIAYWAHIGGFAVGMILTLPLWLKRGGFGFWSRTHGRPPHPETQYSSSRIPVVRRK